MLTQRDRATVEFIRAHLLELQTMARASNQEVLAYFIDMASMEASELLGLEAGRRPRAANLTIREAGEDSHEARETQNG